MNRHERRKNRSIRLRLKRKEIKRMQQHEAQGGVNISPFAILAAILFHVNESEEMTVVPDDSTESQQMSVEVVSIAKEKDAVVCVIPLKKIIKYAQIPYNFQLRSENGQAIISFEKQDSPAVTTLVAPNGQPIANKSDTVLKLLEKLG